VRESSATRLVSIFIVACGIGVCGGLLGVGGGVLLVPLLVVLFGFDQHRAQGTSLVALALPTGLLGFINYARAGEVHWTVGILMALLIMPGVMLGALVSSRVAHRVPARTLQRIFALFLGIVGIWQVISSLSRL